MDKRLNFANVMPIRFKKEYREAYVTNLLCCGYKKDVALKLADREMRLIPQKGGNLFPRLKLF